MKKHFAFVLVLCLMLGTFPAFSEAGGTYLDAPLQDDYIIGVYRLNGDTIVQGTTGLYALSEDQTQLVPYKGITGEVWLAAVSEGGFGGTLLSDGKQLMLFNFVEGKLAPIVIEEGSVKIGEALTLDLSSQKMDGGGQETFYLSPDQVDIIDGRLYLLYGSQGLEAQAKLISFDLKGGPPTALEVKGIRSFAAYKDGQLLVTVDPNTSGDGRGRVFDDGMPIELSVLNLTDGSVTKLDQLNLGMGESVPLCYDAANDRIYLLSRGELLRWDGEGKTVICAYVGGDTMWRVVPGHLQLLPDGRMMVVTRDTLSTRGLNPDLVPKGQLRIYGSFESGVHSKAARALKGMPVRFLDKAYFGTAQELGQALVSGEDSIDILFLDAMNMDLETIKNKGYYQDLNQSQLLKSFVQKTYPDIQKMADHGGKLSMIPVQVSGSRLGYSEKLLKEIGIEPPETFQAFCELIAHWDEKYGEAFPNYLPVITDDYPGYLMDLALNLYTDYCAATGETWSFASPLLKEMLLQAEAVRQTAPSKPINWESPEAAKMMSELYEKREIFSTDSFGDLEQAEVMRGMAEIKPLQLKIKEGTPVYQPVGLRVVVINPKSKQLDSAIKYMEAYVEALDDVVKMAMQPDMNEPIENPQYELQVQQLDAVQAMLEKAVEQADGAEKTQQQSMLDELLRDKDKLKEQIRFRVREETIKQYRQMMAHSYARNYGPVEILLNQEEMQNLVKRYKQQQISLDQFLIEAEGKYRLIRLENQ